MRKILIPTIICIFVLLLAPFSIAGNYEVDKIYSAERVDGDKKNEFTHREIVGIYVEFKTIQGKGKIIFQQESNGVLSSRYRSYNTGNRTHKGLHPYKRYDNQDLRIGTHNFNVYIEEEGKDKVLLKRITIRIIQDPNKL